MVHTPFVPGQIVTAAQMNTISGAWTSYTPTWSSTGTAPAIGNGNISARWKTMGDNLAIVQISMSIPSSGTTTFGSGTFTWTVPTTPSAAQLSYQAIGQAWLTKSGVGETGGVVRLLDSSRVMVSAATTSTSGNNNDWSATVPLTWSTSAAISVYLQFVYEPA